MTPDAKAWSAYRPDALPELSTRVGSEGRIVAVTATDEAIARGWAREIALGLAHGWSGIGVSVRLVDADLVAPALHDALAVENKAGLTDVLLFGSSLAGVSHAVEGGRFQFVTAGSPVGEPELAFQGERWPTVCQQAVRTESTLLVFVPYAAPWSSAILNRATDIIVLAATNDESVSELRLDSRVRAVLAVSSSEPTLDESADPRPVDPLEAWAPADSGGDPFGWYRPGGLGAGDDLPAAEPSSDVSYLEPISTRARQAAPARVDTRSPVRSPFIWGSAILLLTAVAVVQVIRRPEAAEAIAPVLTAPASQTPTDPAPERTASPAEAVGPPARFTVALAAYQDLATATARVQTLAARTSDHLFILAPVEIGGRVFHRLLAGLAPDAAAASRLSGDLSQALSEPSRSWIIRHAPLTFEVARSPILVLATERRDEVRALALPAYVLGVEMSDGSLEYRVYVGAYADADESSHLRSMLNENGLADVALVQRFGTAVR